MAGARAAETSSSRAAKIAIIAAMGSPRQYLVASLLLSVLMILAAAVSPARGAESEAGLLARLRRESDPVRKAKIEIRLSRLKLSQAMSACGKGDFEATNELLAAYLERIKSAWATLKASGRQAHKKPAGFKDLDIALREDSRYLEDLRHRVPYMARSPVDKVAEEVEVLRSEVLKALFPTEPPRKTGDAPLRRAGPNFWMRIT